MTPLPHSASAEPGELRAEYRQGIAGYILLFALLAGCCGAATWLSLTNSTPGWPAASFFALCTVAWSAFGIWGLLRMPWRILLYDELMIVERPGRREPFFWESVTLVHATLVRQQGVPILSLVLHTEDGRKLSFGEMPKEVKQKPGAAVPRIAIDQLIDGLLEVTAAARYQFALRRYQFGQPVEFKKLQISQAGITARGQTISWPFVADIQADDQHMVVKAIGQERPWGVFALHELPNVDILPVLITHIRGTGDSAFQGIERTPALEEAGRASRRRKRLLSWLLLPLLVIGVNLAISYGSYFFSARANYDRGTEALNQGDFVTALRELDEAVRKEPDLHLAYCYRGKSKAMLGQFSQARADVRRCRESADPAVRAEAELLLRSLPSQ